MSNCINFFLKKMKNFELFLILTISMISLKPFDQLATNFNLLLGRYWHCAYPNFTTIHQMVTKSWLFNFFFSSTFRLKNSLKWTCLGSLHTRHFCSRYCNIEIKILQKKDIFQPKYIFSVCIENFFFVIILNILKCHHNILKKIISFYHNVLLSQYLFISILCLKMSSVYKP